MAIFWSSICTGVVYMLRKGLFRHHRYGTSWILLAYILCFVRMIIPVEFAFAKEIHLQKLYNGVFTVMKRPIGNSQINSFVILAAIWIVVSLGLLIRFVYWYRKMIRRIYRFQKHDVRIETISGDIPVVVSAAVASPMAIGIFKSKIVLPDVYYQPEELRYILQHETIHIAHKDIWLKLTTEILCCLFWWNPITYVLNKQVEQTLEIKCDLHMTRHMRTEDKRTYLKTLIQAVKQEKEANEGITQYRLISNLRFFSTKSISLKERFHIVTKCKKEKNERTVQTLLMIITVCVFLLSYTMVFQTKFEPPSSYIESVGFTVLPSDSTLQGSEEGEYTMILSDGSTIRISEAEALLLEREGLHVQREEK
jgi:beta-lactamase regulating signal transducer with metallopeptidase domain